MAKSLAKALKKDYLSCTICLEQYKDPRRLPCDHMFCRTCLVRHVTQTFTTRQFQNYVTCPLCRTEFEGNTQDSTFIPRDWVNNLPFDSLSAPLMQALRAHERNVSVKYIQPHCTCHVGKLRDLFCLTHAQLICWKCAEENHRSCDVDSSDNALPKMLPKVEQLRDHVTQELSSAQKLTKTDRKFDESKTEALNDLARAQHQFEKVKKSIECQFKLMKSDIENSSTILQTHRKEFGSLVDSVLEYNRTLESSLEDGTANNILNAYEVISKEITGPSKVIQKLKATLDKSKVSFMKDALFEEFISNYSGIGYVETGLASRDDEADLIQKKSLSKPTADILKHSNPVGKGTSAELDNHKKSFRHMQDIDAMLEKEDSCFINGMVAFNGQMVYILDRENEKVKQFDTNGTFIDFLPLSGPPHDITCLQPSNKLAITQPDENLIAILSGNRLVFKRYIQTRIPYNGICQVNDGLIAVSSWSMLCVDILSIHGNVLHHISKETGDLKCDLPNLLCTLSDGKIVVTGLDREIMCIVTSYSHGANVQWTHTAPERIYGVCADINKGLVYACVKDRNEVRKISGDGSLCDAAVLSEEDGIFRPMSVCYSNDKLFIADESKIKVFKVLQSNDIL